MRTIKGTAGTKEKAANAAHHAAVKAIAGDVDLRPCPACGLVQPDMVGARRAYRHWIIFWIGLAALAVLLILYLTDLVPVNVLAWMSAGTFGVLTLGQLAIALSNPNRNIAANRALAQASLDKGDIQLGSTPSADQAETPPQAGGPMLQIVLLLLCVTAAATALPEMLRQAAGWPLNKGWYPPVAGPGDATYVYLPNRINSIKGYWNGTARVVAKLSKGDTINIPAESSTTTWGDSISAKSSETSSSRSLWVQLRLPANVSLEGDTLLCNIDLAVTYPVAQGGKFENHSQKFSHREQLVVASANAGRTYTLAWWASSLGGGVLWLVLGLVLIGLARAYKRRALPTKVYPFSEPDNPPAPEGVQ
jgi:hypothetical protein